MYDIHNIIYDSAYYIDNIPSGLCYNVHTHFANINMIYPLDYIVTGSVTSSSRRREIRLPLGYLLRHSTELFKGQSIYNAGGHLEYCANKLLGMVQYRYDAVTLQHDGGLQNTMNKMANGILQNTSNITVSEIIYRSMCSCIYKEECLNPV